MTGAKDDELTLLDEREEVQNLSLSRFQLFYFFSGPFGSLSTE